MSVEEENINFKDFLEDIPEPGKLDHFAQPIGRLAMRYLGHENRLGDHWHIKSGDLTGTMIVDDPKFYSDLALRRQMGIFHGYVEGTWTPSVLGTPFEVSEGAGHDESDALTVINRALLRKTRKSARFFDAVARTFEDTRDKRTLRHLPSEGELIEQNEEEIGEHYDIGDILYRGRYGFLDKDLLQYSAGLLDNDVPPESQSLEYMQSNKAASLIRMMDLKEDGKYLEVGSGWGGLYGKVLQERDDISATTLTLSHNQRDYVLERMEEMDLSDRADVRLEHYRDFAADPENHQKFDSIVSVEMIEAVDWPYLQDYVDSLTDMVDPKGSIVLQTILTSDKHYARYKHKPGFITESVFPGGSLHSQQAIEEAFAKRGFVLSAEKDLTESYVYTLREWRRRFNENFPDLMIELADMGESKEKLEVFQRGWNLYLSSAEAGFAERYIFDKQFKFEKA